MFDGTIDGKIGIFDSGVGGLTVAAKIAELLPTASLMYFGDTKYVPYGVRPVGEVVELVERICRYLVDQGATALVMACNTAAAAAFASVEKWSPVPVFGIIDAAAKAASAHTRNGRIGVISTDLTAQSGVYVQAVHRNAPQAKVFVQGCPKLVLLVEQGRVSGAETEATLHEYIDPMLEEGIDTLVLGCTHFPFLQGALEKMTEGKVAIVDPAVYVAEELQELGYGKGLKPGKHSFTVSGDPHQFARVARQLLGSDIGEVMQALD